MTRRRWIADEVTGNHAALVGSHAEHLIRVLRVRVGQEFDIATGTTVRRGRVSRAADDRVEFELGEEVPVAAPAVITLLLAVFKFDRMEWAIEKCIELGVSRIVPILAQRTDTHLAAASVKRAERWRRLAVQAAEQSRRSAAPEIDLPLKLQDAITLQGNLHIVLAESERQSSLRDALAAAQSVADVVLAVGPEGGWTEDELDRFDKAGWIRASLGSTILRAETAAIAATAIVISELGA